MVVKNRHKHLKEFLKRCRKDIFFFVKYGLCAEPTWQQATIMDQVQAAQFGLPSPMPRHPSYTGPGVPNPLNLKLGEAEPGSRQVADKSGQGPGKTHCSVFIAFWRGFRSIGKSVVTAPTMRQCQDVWLSESKKVLYKAHPYFQSVFDVTATKVVIGKDKRWSIHCITSTDEKKLQGFHDDGLTIICEEMSGIERVIIEQFQGTMSNNDCLLLGIGNPNLRDCAFFDCFHGQRHNWQTYTLNAEETAKYRPDIVSPARNERIAEQYGENSDVYRVRVLGEFPYADPNCVLTTEDLEKCLLNDLQVCAREALHIRSIAIDFARFGGDETVIYRRVGNAIVEEAIFSHMEPTDAVAHAFAMQSAAGWQNGDVWYIPDATGMGQGAMGLFYNANKLVFEFHNGGKAFKQDQYANRVTEAWFLFAEEVKNKRVYLPQDNRLVQQLAARQYKTNNKGQLQLETKDEYCRRTEESSPDRADACVMAFYSKMLVKGLVAEKGPNERVTRTIRKTRASSGSALFTNKRIGL